MALISAEPIFAEPISAALISAEPTSGGVDLRDAWLFEAPSDGAVIKADLRGAILNGADLRGAYLFGADLRGAGLPGTDLREARGLSADQLAGAIGDAKTRLPDGVPRPTHWPPFVPDGEA